MPIGQEHFNISGNYIVLSDIVLHKKQRPFDQWNRLTTWPRSYVSTPSCQLINYPSRERSMTCKVQTDLACFIPELLMEPLAVFSIRDNLVSFSAASTLGLPRTPANPTSSGGTVLRAPLPRQLPCRHSNLALFRPRWTVRSISDAIREAAPQKDAHFDSSREEDSPSIEAFFICGADENFADVERTMRALVLPCVSQVR